MLWGVAAWLGGSVTLVGLVVVGAVVVVANR